MVYKILATFSTQPYQAHTDLTTISMVLTLSEISCFLEKSGFSKTLKSFKKESGYNGDVPNEPASTSSNKRKSQPKNSESDKELEEDIKRIVTQFESEHQLSTPKKKKRKSLQEPLTPVPNKKKEKNHFKRIDEQKMKEKISNEKLLDQSYWSKGGDEFALKAAEELSRVKGKNFRKEMQKKKRASWKGFGQIEDNKVNSVQFDSD